MIGLNIFFIEKKCTYRKKNWAKLNRQQISWAYHKNNDQI